MSILSNHSTVRVMKSRKLFRTSLVFLVVLLLGSAVPALAQQTEAVGAFVEAQRTSITFDMKGQISQEKTDMPAFPLTIIERLVQENGAVSARDSKRLKKLLRSPVSVHHTVRLHEHGRFYPMVYERIDAAVVARHPSGGHL